jgi:hypothetical protein
MDILIPISIERHMPSNFILEPMRPKDDASTNQIDTGSEAGEATMGHKRRLRALASPIPISQVQSGGSSLAPTRKRV